MAYISPMLTNMVGAVKKAAINLHRDFCEIERLQTSIKGSADFTKIAYTKIEKGLRIEVSKLMPNMPVVMINEKLPQGVYLLASCIEGLTNYAHGQAEFAISLALVEGDNIYSGVIYNPARDELYFAESGKGAFKEGFRSHERLRVSAKQDLEGALISIKPNLSDTQLTAKLVNNTLAECNDVRVSGCLALDMAYVASGKFDCMIAPNSSLASMAAGIVLVREAGGMILDINQDDFRTVDLSLVLNSGNLIASNFALSQKITKIVE